MLSLQLARDRARQSEAVRIHMSPWQCRILKPQSSAIRDALNGSKPRMHSFEAVWWNSCSRFEHCAMVPDRIVLSAHVFTNALGA